MKIEVGQIWRDDSETYCLTKANSPNYFSAIALDGRVFGIYSSFGNGETLLATYPTWQEAVNSPEFKGE